MIKPALLANIFIIACFTATSAFASSHEDAFKLAKDKYSSEILDSYYSCEDNAVITLDDQTANLTTLKYFGTSITISLYQAPTEQTRASLCRALSVIQEYHYLASDYSTYPHVTNVKSVNEAPGQSHDIDPQLTALIASAIDWHEQSRGRFNIALSPVIALWRAQRFACEKQKDNCSIPAEMALKQAAEHIDVDKIRLDRQSNKIQLAEGMSIDLGGIAKGWMVEKLYDQLIRDGISRFVINAGGNIRHYGLHPSGRYFNIAIEDPICRQNHYRSSKCQSEQGRYHELIAGSDLTVVSSGNYLKYFMVDGKKYHHIIDPKTLYPETEGISVTVILSDNQIYADVISTMLFLMPVDEGLEYVNSHPWIEAIWYINAKGEKIRSTGFNQYTGKLE